MKRVMVFRPYRASTVAVPVPARSTGPYVVGGDFRENPLRKDFMQLFWGVSGRGSFVINGKEYFLNPDEVCMYFPGDEHRICAVSEAWEYYWLTIDSGAPEEIAGMLGLRREPYAAGRCPREMFIRLQEEVRDFSPAGQRKASATVYAILMSALSGGDAGSESWLVRRYRELVAENFSDGAFNLADAAETLGVHRSTLNRVFLGETGVSPGDFLHQFRIQEALAMLKSGKRRVSEVSEDCGFNDPNYFAKVIRKATGVSPMEFMEL